ncbi:MAG: hypothetical protein KC420_03675 [Myxococcales bacterium]|nr:hypothetical protein [Myxococcales bacterium]
MTRTSLITLALTVSLGACAHKGSSSDFAAGSATYSTGSTSAEATTATGGASVSSRAPSSAPAPAMDEAVADYDSGIMNYQKSAGGEASVGATPPPSRRPSPGLGTSYGETRYSQVHTVPFRRQSDNPDVILSLRYNDPQGVADLSALRGGAAYPSASLQTGALRLSLVGEGGGVLPGAQIGGEVYAVGGVGQRYMIAVENHTPDRYEVVASVDGLDVIDGGEASFSKRGYVVDPYTSFVIEGWRTSDNTIAAFRFSELGDSYAAQTGKARNIGVVGVAFFHEYPAIDVHELRRRETADPFPNRYAPPPPRRVY